MTSCAQLPSHAAPASAGPLGSSCLHPFERRDLKTSFLPAFLKQLLFSYSVPVGGNSEVKPVSDWLHLKSPNLTIELTSAIFGHSEMIIKAPMWVPSSISWSFNAKMIVSSIIFVNLFFLGTK